MGKKTRKKVYRAITGMKNGTLNPSEKCLSDYFADDYKRYGYTNIQKNGGFPDYTVCDPMRGRIGLELEVDANNFFKHGHDPQKCNLVLCWKGFNARLKTKRIDREAFYAWFEKNGADYLPLKNHHIHLRQDLITYLREIKRQGEMPLVRENPLHKSTQHRCNLCGYTTTDGLTSQLTWFGNVIIDIYELHEELEKTHNRKIRKDIEERYKERIKKHIEERKNG